MDIIYAMKRYFTSWHVIYISADVSIKYIEVRQKYSYGTVKQIESGRNFMVRFGCLIEPW